MLFQVIDGMTAEDAINIMQEAHENGLACVIVCPQEDAERWAFSYSSSQNQVASLSCTLTEWHASVGIARHCE